MGESLLKKAADCADLQDFSLGKSWRSLHPLRFFQ